MKNNSMKKEVEFDYAEARIPTKKSSKSHDSKPNSSDVKTGHGTPVTGNYKKEIGPEGQVNCSLPFSVSGFQSCRGRVFRSGFAVSGM
jgi:hypothetical protein